MLTATLTRARRATLRAYLSWLLREARKDVLITEAEFQAAPAKLRHMRGHVLALAERIDQLEAQP